jgi:8-oxo-dGTP pyrophosphatase MutT (NUDIX family)
MLMRLTAAAVVQNPDGKFLIVEERAQGAVVLNTPSGRWEPGESLAETAARECAEEAGVLFVPEHFLGAFITIHTSSSNQQVCTVRLAFCGHVTNEPPKIARDSAILSVQWLSYDQLVASRARHRSSAVMRCIDDYLAGRRYPLSAVNHMIDS